MRVLWICDSCSLQNDEKNLGLTARYEAVLMQYGKRRIDLGIAYSADGKYDGPIERNGIVYYPVKGSMGLNPSPEMWTRAKEDLLRIVDVFQPDLIQCFGAEWTYGRIAESVQIPVVIHMMGFLNIYFLSIAMARGEQFLPVKRSWTSILLTGRKKLRRFAAVKILRRPKRSALSAREAQDRMTERERGVMSVNRFFTGRTEWDKNIVRYYSPGAKYYHIPELVKPGTYAAAGSWSYHYNGKLRLLTYSSGDDRKGNEIILRTAKILKEITGLAFEWRVAGFREFFQYYEAATGIRHEDMNIELLGMIENDQIIEELTEADFFIHPSIMDNSPHAICEAQLIGCPVLASNVGGVPQLVTDKVTGWLYPYHEPHTLAFLIANLCQSPDLLTHVSRMETEMAVKRHDPQRIAEDLLETYEKIIQCGHLSAE